MTNEVIWEDLGDGFRIKKHHNITFLFNGSRHVGNIHAPKDDDLGEHKAVSKHWKMSKNFPVAKDALNWLVTINNIGTPAGTTRSQNNAVSAKEEREIKVAPKKLGKIYPPKAMMNIQNAFMKGFGALHTEELDESFTQHFPYKKVETEKLGNGESHHSYHFHTPKGGHYEVNFSHTHNKASYDWRDLNAERLGNKEEFGITGKEGTHAAKVLSTTSHIFKHHMKKHPEIEHVHLTSAEPNRTRLYRHIIEKHWAHHHTETPSNPEKPDKYVRFDIHRKDLREFDLSHGGYEQHTGKIPKAGELTKHSDKEEKWYHPNKENPAILRPSHKKGQYFTLHGRGASEGTLSRQAKHHPSYEVARKYLHHHGYNIKEEFGGPHMQSQTPYSKMEKSLVKSRTRIVKKNPQKGAAELINHESYVSFKQFMGEELEDRRKRDKEMQIVSAKPGNQEIQFQVKKTMTGQPGDVVTMNPELRASNGTSTFISQDRKKSAGNPPGPN